MFSILILVDGSEVYDMATAKEKGEPALEPSELRRKVIKIISIRRYDTPMRQMICYWSYSDTKSKQKAHCKSTLQCVYLVRPKGFAKPRPRNAPPGRFCPAGRKARGTGCSKPFFYCPIKSMQNKKSSTHKMLLLVRPKGFEPPAPGVGELRQDSIDRRWNVNFVSPAQLPPKQEKARCWLSQ